MLNEAQKILSGSGLKQERIVGCYYLILLHLQTYDPV